MFKKITHILLAIILLILTTGFSVTRHYCGDTLKSVHIFSEAKSCCDIPMEGCCHNEKETFQVKEDYTVHLVLNNVSIPQLISSLFVFELFNISELIAEDSNIVSFTDSSPPPTLQTVLSQLQTYLL